MNRIKFLRFDARRGPGSAVPRLCSRSVSESFYNRKGSRSTLTRRFEVRSNLRSHLLVAALSLLSGCLIDFPASAAPFFFSTGNVTNSIATASRPESPGAFEIESADDFVLTSPTAITSATFTGLLTGGATTANIGEVVVEIYRVFPADSDVARTSGPPTFSTPQVPTRVNSPSDVEFVGRSTATGDLTFKASLLNPTFTALNSVQAGGIHVAN